MRESDETKPKKERVALDRSDWMAILAVFISCGAFLVSLYEAKMMKEQQKIMQSQQRASVWPYLEADLKPEFDTSSSSYTFGFINRGVGPARIKHFELSIDDQIIEDFQDIQEIFSTLELTKNKSIGYRYTPPSGVVSADNNKEFLKINKQRKNQFDFDFLDFSKIKIGFKLCYCSIFGDCWTITESTSDPIEGCEVENK